MILCSVALFFSECAILSLLHPPRYLPVYDVNNYRLYGAAVKTPYVRNQYANRSVFKEWKAIWKERSTFRSNDSMLLYKRPYPIDSILNRDVHICSPDTFLIMMTPVRQQDFSIRQVMRKVIPQGIIVEGKKINRVFVISVADNDREKMREVRKEMELYGDIIISRHEDAYSSIHLYVWDGYLWIRDHCHSAVYAGKFETDAIHFLGNLITLLSHYPTRRLYGGRSIPYTIKARNKRSTVDVWSVPFDYPGSTSCHFVSGVSNVLSMDTLDYLITGAAYEPFFVCADDQMTGLILHRVGIEAIEIGTMNCPYQILRHNCEGKYREMSNAPLCMCCYDSFKDVKDYEKAVAYFGQRIYKSSVPDKVDIHKGLQWRGCY